jgi:pectin methylesterase-like acyl-CoA thioesterase
VSLNAYMIKKILQLAIILYFSFYNLSSSAANQWQPDANLSAIVRQFENENTKQIVVDINGGGDFNSIQKAIDSIPQENTQRVVVLIKPGFYKQRVLIGKNKPFITLRSSYPYKTIISYDLNSQMMRPDGVRTYGSDAATLVNRGSSDIILENLTIENTFGPHPQAQAAKLAAERALMVNCRLLGWQDTLMTHSGRQYYLNCYIEGGTDFIYGHAQAVFENCIIHSKESSHITAHAATEPNLPTGYVFYNCKVTTADGIVTDLGRPWRAYGRVVYYNCWLDKGVMPFGWNNWSDPNREKTAFFAEYNSSGPGANPEARAKWSHQLTEQQAEKFLPENFMKIDGQTIDPWLAKILEFRKTISKNIKNETIYNVRDYGAKGDGQTVDTNAIQTAIDTCGNAGGGVVLLPAGIYLSTPIFLKDKVTLQLDEGAKLKATDNPQDFIKKGRAVEAAKSGGDYDGFINGKKLTDVAIVGKGVIDGSGVKWWIPAEKAREKQPGYTMPRPRLVLLENCKNVKIIGVSLVNSPSFHLVPKRCENVLIEGVTIRCPSIAPNTDAIDPSECQNVRISKCLIDVGDDNVAMKSGSQNPQYPDRACANIIVSDCTFLHGHGMSIGSETNGGVFNLLVENCTFERLGSGIRIKSSRGKGGLVENITYRNIIMNNVKIPINISSWYQDDAEDETAQPMTALTPVFRNIRIQNVLATSPYGAIDIADRITDFFYYYYAHHAYLEPRNAGIIAGLPESKVSDILLENVHIKADKGMRIQNAENIKFKNVKIETLTDDSVILKNAKVAEL